jgi:hypothetical protein
MIVERCHRCVGNPACEKQVVNECLPIPFFGDITKPNLKVVTIGLNPALNEFYINYIKRAVKERSQRLAMLGDYNINARTDLCDADVDDAKRRRDGYFVNHERHWHSYFEKMESVLTRVSPAWTYAFGSAVHIDLVACATQSKFGDLSSECKSALIGNCREHFLSTLSSLPNGTIILCDGPRATREIQNWGLPVKMQPVQQINVREVPFGDTGWRGELSIGDKKFPFCGWSSQVNYLSAVWRIDLASWIHGLFFPSSPWASNQARK